MSSAAESVQVRHGLDRCDFVVMQAMLEQNTNSFCDVILPGTSFAEKTGTFTNTERRIQMVHQAIEPLGDSRPDWQILQDLAGRMQKGEAGITGTFAEWNYHDTSDIMAEIAALTPIYSGVSHARLEHEPRLIWPVESPDPPGTPDLLADALGDRQILLLTGLAYFF